MDNFSKISQLTALCSWRRSKINKGSSWSDGNLNLLNVLKFFTPWVHDDNSHTLVLSTNLASHWWWKTDNWRFVKLLSFDLCCPLFLCIWSDWESPHWLICASCTNKQRSILSLMQKWFFQEGNDAAQAKTRPCMARPSVMMICYKVVWLFINNLKKLKPLLNIFT